ncbi:MAG: diguanylate cyclase [Pseudomonadota bacterium]
MRIQTKTSFFYLITTLIMVFVIILVSLLSFRQFSINSAKNHSQTVAEIVRVGLTELMINGAIDKRVNYLKRLTQIEGLVSTRITRSDHVRKQYKEGLESEKIKDDIDRQVLHSGEPVFVLENEGLNPILRSTIPFIADGTGIPNCLTCHQVPSGTVLGTITIRTAIGHLKSDALTTVGILSAVVIFFAIVTLFFFRRLFRPLISTAGDVQKAVANAKEGIFNVRVKKCSNDEIGQIALDLNALMDYLSDGLAHINKSVSQLIDFKATRGTDSLANTISMIESLADAAMFKQSIEEDETKEEVYERLGRILQEDFYVREFTIYEVNNSAKNKINPVIVDGIAGAACKWCDPEIMIRADACRAKRTGHVIDSIETPHICNYFNNDNQNKQHICLPIIQSGAVGSVVQIVSDMSEGKHYQELIPFMQPYLREASPVIETKRLMATLKESNLRDAMTGLNNRRFLEEYVDTMVANTTRNNSSISILMLDLDYFKKVNDSYGHDIGDKVLIELSKILVKSVRASDMVIRYGGEEFLIILQNTSEKFGDQMAEKIRLAVEEMKIQVTGGDVIQKTISIGIADFPDDGETFWQALKYADVALYKAKEQGRNQSVHFAAEMWTAGEEF